MHQDIPVGTTDKSAHARSTFGLRQTFDLRTFIRLSMYTPSYPGLVISLSGRVVAPMSAAQCSAVQPASVAASTSAPAPSSSKTQAACPLDAAQCSGRKPACEGIGGIIAGPLTGSLVRSVERPEFNTRTAPKRQPPRTSERMHEHRPGNEEQQQQQQQQRKQRKQQQQQRKQRKQQQQRKQRKQQQQQQRKQQQQRTFILAAVLAPAASRRCVQSVWPLYTAQWSGLQPAFMPSSMSAPIIQRGEARLSQANHLVESLVRPARGELSHHLDRYRLVPVKIDSPGSDRSDEAKPHS